MKKVRLILALGLCTMILSLFISCQKDSEKIIGKWKWSDDTTSQYLESGTWVGENGITAKWEIENELLILSEGPMGFGMSFRILEFDSDRIVVEQTSNGKKLVGTRIE